MPHDSSTDQIVEEALQAKGLRDDMACIVVDVLPQEKPPAPLPPQKKPRKGVLKGMFHKRTSESSSQVDQEYIEPDSVELYEAGSAMLSQRLDTKYPPVQHV